MRVALAFCLALAAALSGCLAGSDAVYIEPAPSYLDQEHAKGIMDAAQSAVEYWNEEFVNFHMVDSADDADVVISWIRDFGGETAGQHIPHGLFGGLIQVGLGDAGCAGYWQYYSAAGVELIIKHELGHQIGLDHVDEEGALMSPQLALEYQSWCPFVYENMELDARYYGWQSFELHEATTVHYRVESRSQVVADACIVKEGDEEDWGNRRATEEWACASRQTEIEESASLDAGIYSLMMRCSFRGQDCSLDYAIG